MPQSSLGSTYRLETFGKLTLIGGATGTLSHQRRRLALLALLAASGERGMSRDQLIGYLWPESSGENGRHSLEQLLHALRRALSESVFKGTNPVTLDTAVIASDVNDFEHALARGDLIGAVDLYAGPFLHGFYLDDAAEFERWATGERARLANRHSETLKQLAIEAEGARDNTGAIRWRRRQVEADPVSSRSALALMRALVASGDQTAALQHARIYEELVRQELESDPDPTIVAYAAALRSGNIEHSAERAHSAMSALPVDIAAPAETVSQPQFSTAPPPLVISAPSKPSRRWRMWWLAAIPFAALVLFAVNFSKREGRSTLALDPDKIVVLPFRVTSPDSSLNYLGDGIVDLVAPMLTGEGGPTAVDSRTAISTWKRITRGRDGTAADERQVARELGAGLSLSGALVESGGRLTITGNLTSDNESDARALASVEGPVDSVDTMLDRFVGQLLTRHSGVAEASISSVTSQSLPAIRAYLNGRAAYRRAEEAKAIESFSRALDFDSTFALAALDLAVATGKVLRAQVCRNKDCRVFSILPGIGSSERLDDQFDRAVRLAWANRLKLGRRDRPLLDALRGNNYPRASSARETMDNLLLAVVAAPDRPETFYLLGTLLLYQGRAMGLSDWRARAEAAFRQASKLDSSYVAPLARLVEAAAFADDTAALRRTGVFYLSRDSMRPSADYIRWLVVVGTGDTAGHRAIRARLGSFDLSTLDQIFLTSQMSGQGLDDGEIAATRLSEARSDPIEKSVALRREHLLALNRGRPSEATRFLRLMDDQKTSSFQFPQFAISAAMFDDGDRALADSSGRALARALAVDTLRPQSLDALRRTSVSMLHQSLVYLEQGDTVRAKAASDWLRRHVEGLPRNRISSLLTPMLMASRARRSEGVALRAVVDSAAFDGCCDFPPMGSLLLARAYVDAGDDANALRVIRRGVWYYPPRHITTQLREEGRLAARLGDRAGAIRAYEKYLAMRSHPEPGLVAQRDSVQAEVNRLKRSR